MEIGKALFHDQWIHQNILENNNADVRLFAKFSMTCAFGNLNYALAVPPVSARAILEKARYHRAPTDN
ncbi:hypothetical protein MKY41_08325 [Sporosarcina sp. FSL W7-1349]|uniref:hypothetical protein n=1 Tax=Sporosarcina sp. FSL W7-1349 TaxID=2921561 RepID=UPI0030F4CCBD